MSADTATLTLTAVYSGQTLTEIVALAKAKGGYEIVSSLPATSLFEGRIVYLSTDDKLYRYDGANWIKAVDGADISAGTVTTNALAAGSVTAAKISVTSLSAIVADVGLLRTASSGARSEIEANQIRVYDSAGTMRVRIGVW